MKTLSIPVLAALMLVSTSALSSAGEPKKNAPQIQATSANTQIIIRHLKLRLRAYQRTQ